MVSTAKTVDPDSRVFVVDLPVATPSLNELMAWKHHPSMRRWRYARHRSFLERLLAKALDGSPLLQAGEPRKVRVTVVRYSAGVLDDANLRGGCKPLLDVLVDLGVLHDDSPRWVEDRYEQRLGKRGEKRTRIELEVL
jgi:hypothetical protein